MANTTEGGFRFIRMKNGAKDYNPVYVEVANNYSTGIFRGDCLKLVSDGTVAVAAAGDSVDYIADGVVQYVSSGKLRGGTFLPANTTFTPTTVGSPNASILRVIPVRDAVFEVDCGTTGTDIATAQGIVGNNCDHHVGSGGSTTSGRSSHYLDNASPGTATAGWRILSVSKRLDNDVSSANWKAEVEINESNDTQYTATGV